MSASNILLAVATIFVALMSGLFYSYSCSVSPGLARLPNGQYISAMQSINRAIQNTIFFISFFGCLLLLPIATYFNYSQPASVFYLLLFATVIYFFGSFLVTVFGNIPLNKTLDKFDLAKETNAAVAAERTLFELKWNRLNNIRTISSLLALICAVLACIYSHNKTQL